MELYKKTADPKVLGELYQRYMDLVYGVCLKYLKHPENAQDSVINIFEELVTKLQKHEVDNFKGWLHTLARNHCLMRLRSEKKNQKVNIDVELVQSVENVHLNGELDKEENFIKLEYCLDQLQAEQKKVIELFYLQGKCYNEITAMTGMEWSKVRSYIQNGRRNLKICMDSQKANTLVENGIIKK
ncbi:MAG TPA: sigma-70 family RNA polymerase sigma factor [Flavisolibacter sp.]